MTDTTVDPTGRRERRRLATRGDLVRAAQELIAADGPGVSVQALADRADVALATVYSHFDSKDALMRAACVQALADFEADVVRATDHIVETDLRWALRLRLYLRMADSHPQTAKVLSHATPETMANPLGYSPTAARDVEQAQAEGLLDCPDIPLRLMAATAAADRFVALGLLDPKSPASTADELAQALLEFCGVPHDRATWACAYRLPKLAAAPRLR